ncbi:hypothetical protein [Methanobacterium sp. ACI-7]|uniref:hypothetical protein n=1 Tax=unclassified Methanobacterium TaxID=2627676 RepID=UPI0039C2B9F7
MKCRKCGRENPDNEIYCSNCKMPLKKELRHLSWYTYEVNFKQILIGTIATIILLGISFYTINGATILFGLVLIFFGGFIAGVLDKNILLYSNDLSAAVNGGIVGFVGGLVFVLFANSVLGSGLDPMAYPLFAGGGLGLAAGGGAVAGSINYYGQKYSIIRVIAIVILISIVAIMGYGLNQAYIT